jgi:copper ion binding protein
MGFIRDAQAAGLTLPEIGVILDMKAEGESTCDHVVLLLEEHVRSVERQAAELQRTREQLQGMLNRARQLDPAECRDRNRCQTIAPSELQVAPRTERHDMTTRTTLNVPEIHCDHCKSSLEGAVGALEGIDFVEVSVPNATVEVGYDDEAVSLAKIKDTIEEQGYAVAN